MAHFMTWVLEALAKHRSRALVKELIHSESSESAPQWISRSYETFQQDLGRSASYWVEHLSALSLNQNDVVGLWITGVEYSDLVHIYGLSRAGFVPQVLNANATVPIIRDLFRKTGGKALVYAPEFAARVNVTDMEVKSIPSVVIPELSTLPAVSSLPALPDVTPDDIALIFHTTGTTSGVPKPVPETHRVIRMADH
ncbi:hypothetical protein B0H13DRAFT_1879812 [Mycena leptocephala]|nr:hypothetical protein B0H13DRAFT_1879812 [Mycena leptocephala]